MRQVIRNPSDAKCEWTLLRFQRTWSSVACAGLLGVFAAVASARAQDRRVDILRERWEGTSFTVSASSENGAEVGLTTRERNVRFVAKPTELRAWADSAMTLFRYALAAPPTGAIEVRTGPISGIDGTKMDLVRSTSTIGTRNLLTVTGNREGDSTMITLTDSLVRIFAIAVRSAAVAEIGMAGEQCSKTITSEIASRGKPSLRERGSKDATQLFERLTWQARSGATSRLYVWGGKQPGCRTEG